MNKKNLILIFSLTLFALGLAGLISNFMAQKDPHKIDLSHLGGDFTVKGLKGDIKLSDYKGKPVILYFGFTACPDVCPLALNNLNRVLDKLPLEKRNEVVKIFISVDWKRDNEKTVDEYTRFFADDIIGTTGSQEQIEKVTKQYAVYYKFVELKDSAMGYTVDHSSRFYVIDRNGKLKNSFSDINHDPQFLKTVGNL